MSDITVKAYYPRVKDFERDPKDNSFIYTSLEGPARLAATDQFTREQAIAGAELKMLQKELSHCYYTNGVNHIEACKDLASEIFKRITHPYFGMIDSPSK